MKRCDKCGKDTPPHDTYQCEMCRARCCRSCLALLKFVGQADRCHECEAIKRNQDIAHQLQKGKTNGAR